MKFTPTIQGSGNKTGIEVPDEVLVALDAGKRPPVVVTVNGRSYRKQHRGDGWPEPHFAQRSQPRIRGRFGWGHS